MTKQEITDRELSERDLLITVSTQITELKTEVRYFKDETKSRFDKIDDDNQRKTEVFLGVNNKIASLEQRVEENSNFRKWTYSSIVSGIVAIILSAVGLITRIK